MAESVRKQPKICGVCGQVLDQWQGGWIHAAELAGKTDHIAVPVDYDERMLVTHCDFCHGEMALADRWVLPAEDFMLPTGSMSQGAWAACPTCARLIAADDWKGLIDRHMHEQQAKATGFEALVFRSFLAQLYGEVKTHQTGPVRPWEPGDETVEHQED